MLPTEQQSGIPYTDELNIDVNGKCAFESIGLLPTDRIRPGIHLVRKWNLLEIARRQEADLTIAVNQNQPQRIVKVTYLVQHTSQCPSCVSASGEAEHADAITVFVCRKG